MRPIIKAALLITTIVLTVLGLYRYSHATNSIVIPTTDQIARMNAESHDRYIVVFKEDASDDDITKYASQVESSGGKITHPYQPSGIMKTFSGHIPNNFVTTLEGASPIEYVEKDKIMTTQ
ncbi:hypothetical protein E3P99_00988 [Wallemia hederae]|uniref:Inhibitor I9 domain-containing protein n=1 Tax=Wallemia hederae TaxID=1540922 RepID=A0A4T0FSA7_9BASI|nr:hypothetical protein E3P99_00988 [Wallemia hederae]